MRYIRPMFYDANNNQLSASAFGVRHLFTGQQWYPELGLYDLRNRFYSPDLGRFLQPDPIGFEGDATNLYRYCGNNPTTASDPTGEYPVYKVAGGYFYYIVNPGYQTYIGNYVPGSRGWCAWGAQILAGVPDTKYWFQGPALGAATPFGAVVATGWQNGRYPSAPIGAYKDPTNPLYGQTVNHTGIFLGFDKDGNAIILDQYTGKPLGKSSYSPDGWYEVNVPKDKGLNTSGAAKGQGAGGSSPFGYFPNLSGGLGWGSYGFAWGDAPWAYGQNPWGAWGNLGNYSIMATNLEARSYGLWFASQGDNLVAVHDPAMGLEMADRGTCFVAGTPVLMADGSEKPIEDIQVGEEVLSWNEEAKSAFRSKVVEALHHNEKMETLFDIELEDGRKFTVNNNHPMYVVEDGDFKFTDELAARFAMGEQVTFQDNNERPIKVTSVLMRKQICKMYNLHVEGQGKNGHTFYANGILVHNFGAGFRRK